MSEPAWIALGAVPVSPPVVGYGTSLPASPADGDEYVLVDSLTAPTYAWRFRYVASITDSYKWVFIGGSPLRLGPQGNVSITVAMTWIDITGGPVLTVPRAGRYEAYMEIRIFDQITTAGYATYVQMLASSSGAGTAISPVIPVAQYDGSRISFSESRVLAASETLRIQGRIDAAYDTAYSDAILRLVPVRVA